MSLRARRSYVHLILIIQHLQYFCRSVNIRYITYYPTLRYLESRDDDHALSRAITIWSVTLQWLKYWSGCQSLPFTSNKSLKIELRGICERVPPTINFSKLSADPIGFCIRWGDEKTSSVLALSLIILSYYLFHSLRLSLSDIVVHSCGVLGIPSFLAHTCRLRIWVRNWNVRGGLAGLGRNICIYPHRVAIVFSRYPVNSSEQWASILTDASGKAWLHDLISNHTIR